MRFHELHFDPDAYLGISQNIAAGRGFTTPGTDQPTAFRPPLYPLLISLFADENSAAGRGILNILAGTGGVIFVWAAAGNLGLSRSGRVLATLIYGCDPLLLRYASMSMTETVCAFLSAVLIWRFTKATRADCRRPGDASEREQTAHQESAKKVLLSSFVTGIVFAACVLTRPTFWVFGGFAVLFRAWCLTLRRDRPWRMVATRMAGLLIGVGVPTGLWVLRNAIVLGTPVLMTTHGGYTVLLGNNEAFYAEVVRQPWGTVWDGTRGPGQAVWATEVNRQMDELGLVSEVSRDRWMATRARQTIVDHPVLFLQASLLRFLRFWNVVPSGPAAEQIPATVRLLVGSYYSLLWITLMIGTLRIYRLNADQRIRWWPVFFLIVAFTCVHLLYWSNVRMRAPIVPAIALLAAACSLRKTGHASGNVEV